MLILFTSPASALTIPEDKKKHFIAGAGIMTLAKLCNLKYPFRYVLLAGIGKEVYDYYGDGTAEVNDTLATALGGLTIKISFSF